MAECNVNSRIKYYVKKLERMFTQRGARLQIMKEWMQTKASGPCVWAEFLEDNPDAKHWFDENGVPK